MIIPSKCSNFGLMLVGVSVFFGVFIISYFSTIRDLFKESRLSVYTTQKTIDEPFKQPIDIFEKFPIDFENATAVFNTVHGALKQKNANLNPVGISFIPAYIPPNTLLYHSTSSPVIPELFEWIAMDYEFSYDFAHVFRNGKSHGHPPGNGKKPPAPGGHGGPGGPGGPGDNHPRNLKTPFLYTFRTTKPLTKLIYLDGASAAKTNTGEMDQQLILSKQEDADERVNEYEASAKICEWGKPFGLDGIIRLEIGFEIVICDFKNHLDLVSNVTLNNATDLLSFPGESSTPSDDLELNRSLILDVVDAMKGFEHIQAGAIADNREPRILLDFSKMVTPINKTWINPSPYHRRINHLSPQLKQDIIGQLETNLHSAVEPYMKTDWQLISNRIVDKFGPMLILLNTTLTEFDYHHKKSLRNSLDLVAKNMTELTFNFVRRYSDDTIKDSEIKMQKAFDNAIIDYVYYNYPLTSSAEILIYSSIFKIQSTIQSTIFNVFEISKRILADIYVKPTEVRFDDFKTELLQLKQDFNHLLHQLNWSIFTQCSSKCNWDEVCYIPTWGPGPMGWGSSENKWFEFDGDRYVIGKNLFCVSYRDLKR